MDRGTASRDRLRAVLAAAVMLVAAAAPVAHSAQPPQAAAAARIISATPALPRSCLSPGAGAPSADSEPTMAVDPSDPTHLAAAWYVEQPGAFGAKAAVVAVSRDGGRSWQPHVVKGIDSCSGRADFSASGGHNITLAYGVDGALYVEAQSGRPGGRDAGGDETEWVVRSADGDRTWGSPVAAMTGSSTFGIPDQGHITADPVRPGVLYLITQVKDPEAYATGNTSTGKAYFTSSTDGGRTWTAPVLAYAPETPFGQTPYSHHLHVLTDGTLVDVFIELNGTGTVLTSTPNVPARIYVIRSTDRGQHWSLPVPVADEIGELSSRTAADDQEGSGHWLVPPFVQSTATRDGTLFVVWHDAEAASRSVLHLARSTDGGLTWQQTTPPAPSTRAYAPNVTLSPDGTVSVAWYDQSADTAGTKGWLTTVELATSLDQGRTWRQQRLAGPMDLAAARPLTSNIAVVGAGDTTVYLGDYLGLVPTAHGVAASVVVTGARAVDGPTDIQFVAVRDSAPPVTSLDVSFTVTNANGSKAPVCTADGRSYTVRGTIVGPAALLRRPVIDGATLYLHGATASARTVFRFTAVPGYDFADLMAQRGHVSVLLDRLGYGSSAIPDGYLTCIGADASIAHQVIGALRSGHYSATGRHAPRLLRVAIAGFSAGMASAQVEAYSFDDVAAVIGWSYADQGSSSDSTALELPTVQSCLTGGRTKGTPAQPGYADFLAGHEDAMFHQPRPGVLAAMARSRESDPCGFSGTELAAQRTDTTELANVHVPVLLAYGDHDAFFPPDAARAQLGLYAGSRDKTLRFVAGAGHFLTLDGPAARFRVLLDRWLSAHGF